MIVQIQGVGSFDVPADKIAELIEWITASARGVRISENIHPTPPDGKQLLQEQFKVPGGSV